jgi:hypothetical protein
MSCRFLSWVAALAVSLDSGCAVVTDAPPVPINECRVGRFCVVEGTLVATHQMGSIKDKAGCVAVALPPSIPDAWDALPVRASGMIYKAPDEPGLVTYKLRGRDVDAEACYSGLVMFVDRIEKV